MKIVKLLPLATLFLFTACDSQLPPEPKAEAAPLPAEVCRKIKESLDKLQGASALVYNANGEATIEREVWLSMGSAPQEQLAQALGLHAACSSRDAPIEREVVIKDEGGQSLMQRIVDTRPNIGELLGKDEP